jgi:tetrahydromethanopterin S-methyltransferase subunit E
MPRSKKFNYAIATLLCIGIFCFAVKWFTEIFDASKSSIKGDGTLVEPYFFLIPVGWLFLIIGLVVVAVKVVLSLIHRVR